MKKFIGKVEAFNLFMAGEDGIIALDNKTEEIISFCDICLAEYRDCDTLQYMIEDIQKPEIEIQDEELPEWVA